MICPNCGVPNESNEYCSNCGARLNQDTQILDNDSTITLDNYSQNTNILSNEDVSNEFFNAQIQPQLDYVQLGDDIQQTQPYVQYQPPQQQVFQNQLQQPVGQVTPPPINQAGQLPPPPPPLTNQNKPNNNSNTAIIIVAVIVAVVVIVGIIVGAALIINKNKTQEINQPSYTVEHSTREQTSEYTTEATTQSVNELGIDESSLSAIISSYSSSTNSSVVIYNLNNGSSFEHNETSDRIASAMVVFPLVYAYSEMIDSGVVNLDDTVGFIYFNEGRTALSKNDADNVYTIEELFYYALRYSDNNAINTLIYYCGMDYINEVCQFEYPSVQINKYVAEDSSLDNYINAEDLANLIRDMYNEKGTAFNILSNMGRCVDDEYGSIGFYQFASSTLGFNAYTGTIYHEIALITGSNGDKYLFVLLSNDDKSYMDGANEASAFGELF